MKFAKSLLILAATAILFAASTNAVANSASLLSSAPASLQSSIANGYIVKLRKGSKAQSFVSEHKNFIKSTSAQDWNATHTYSIGSFEGFAGQLSEQQVQALQKDPRIEYVQKQNIMTIYGQQANPPSWGLTRLSEKTLDLKKPYVYPDSAGSGVEIWIIDTGVQENHSDFEGRAKLVKSFVQGEENTDLNGHGTHVAGTAASKTYGVAKKATIHAVKVLGGQGSGSDSSVIAGIQYVTQNATPGKSVVNMSLGGKKSKAVDDAVNAAADAGVVFIVAAGNDSGADACQSSPSGAEKVFAVAASDKRDQQADFSNVGKCVKAYAPGVGITSLWKGANGATNTIDGTSMASPHVAGVAALYVGTGKYKSPSEVYAAMIADGTKDAIKGASDGTPNVLIYNQPGGGGSQPGPSPSPAPSPAPSPDPTPDPKNPDPTPDPKNPDPTPDPKNPDPTPDPGNGNDGGDGIVNANASKYA